MGKHKRPGAALDALRLKFEIGRLIDAASYDLQYGGNKV